MNTERILKVLALAMEANPDLPIPLTLDNIDLVEIQATPTATRNTHAVMAAKDTGEIVRYVGSAGVVYDRVDIALFWKQFPIIESSTAVTVADLVVILKAQYGLDVYESEVLNTDALLPTEGMVTIEIDDSVSPLYVGKTQVQFTKDAGIEYQDGMAYTLPVINTALKPILGWVESTDAVELSVNGSAWTAAMSTKDTTGLYAITPAVNLTAGTQSIRLRGAKIMLIDYVGNYVPIVKLVQYKSVTEATGYFSGIKSLTEIAPNAFETRPDLTNADYLFDQCTGLSVLPEMLFSFCLGLTSARACFRNTAVVTIPETLLMSCAKLTDATSMFEQCVNLTTVPAKLFESNTALITLASCFVGCTEVTSPLDASFLSTLVNLQDASYLFSGWGQLTIIPTTLFTASKQLTTLVGTFKNCVGITVIPTKLLTGLTKLNRIDRLFEGCSNITLVPSTVLANLTNLEYAEYTFAGTGITSTPANLFTTATRLLSIDYIFSKCTRLTIVPDSILYPIVRLESLNGVWQNCIGITSFPYQIFSASKNVVSCNYLFSGSGILVAPSGMFAGMPKVKSVVGMFSNSVMTTVAATLFNGLPNLEDASLLFYRAVYLKAVPATLFSANPKLTSLYGTFAYSQILNEMSILDIFTGSPVIVSSVTNVKGLYYYAMPISGTFSDLRALLSGVDFTNPEVCQGVVANCSLLTDYDTIGAIFKADIPGLV